MRRIRWVLVGLMIALALAAAIRSAGMHGTGAPVPTDSAVGQPIRGIQGDRKPGDASPPSARQAPEFPRADAGGWINSPPLSMAALRGKVVVLDVFTFG